MFLHEVVAARLNSFERISVPFRKVVAESLKILGNYCADVVDLLADEQTRGLQFLPVHCSLRCGQLGSSSMPECRSLHKSTTASRAGGLA